MLFRSYPGFGKRRAFWHFEYNFGDNMTWELINLIWPGGWEVMGRKEAGSMVNGPLGDTFDILLQNAPQKVLNSYPCLILSGDIRLSSAEKARYTNYVRQGGTLILNTAYLRDFPQYASIPQGAKRHETTSGKGRVIVYGPDFQVDEVAPIIREELARCLPVRVSPGVEYLVNVKAGSFYVTLINNDGVTKEPRSKPVIDASQVRRVSVSYQGKSRASSVTDIKNHQTLAVKNGTEVALSIPAGQVAILEFKLK